MNKFSSPFMAKSPLKEKQSLQAKYKKFKAKAGNKIRKFLGEPDPTIKDPKDYNPPVKKLNKSPLNNSETKENYKKKTNLFKDFNQKTDTIISTSSKDQMIAKKKNRFPGKNMKVKNETFTKNSETGNYTYHSLRQKGTK